MAIKFQKAKREQIWLKLLLGGPSGSGKTYSALKLATGLAQESGSGIAYIDTENGRARYYAGEFDFDDIQFEAPFTPEKYIETIDAAVENGYKILIIDSISHEWQYCLDVHNAMPGNSYTNWAKVTPRHDAFMEKILQSPIHIISTVRGKDEYVLEEKNGKQAPKKVGVGYNQRDNVEYSYTVTFNLAQDTHVADATKDNTHLFEGRYEKLTEKDGKALYQWANAGIVPVPKEKPSFETAAAESVEDVIAKIKVLVNEVKDAGIDRDTIGAAIEGACGMKNYTRITDVNIAKRVFDALANLKEG